MNKIVSIICDDCEKAMSGMESESIDMILSDIPYGINFKSNKQNYCTRFGKIEKKSRPEYFKAINGDSDIPLSWLSEAYRLLKPHKAIYIFCHWKKWKFLEPAVEKVGFTVKNMIVMNKSNHGMGDLKGQYAPKHELVLFATKKRHKLNFREKRLNDVMDVPVKFSGGKRLHPNEKPLSWLMPFIESSTEQGELILDPFAGSGSTAEASAMCNRRSIVIDNEEKWADVMKNRLRLYI